MTNRPRRFFISPVYVDERRERLEAIEQQARRELGLHVTTESSASTASTESGASTVSSVSNGLPAYNPAALRQAFRSAQQHRRVGAWLWAPMVLSALALILIIGVMLFL